MKLFLKSSKPSSIMVSWITFKEVSQKFSIKSYWAQKLNFTSIKDGFILIRLIIWAKVTVNFMMNRPDMLFWKKSKLCMLHMLELDLRVFKKSQILNLIFLERVWTYWFNQLSKNEWREEKKNMLKP